MRILLMADIHIGSIKEINYVYSTITDIIDKEIIFTHSDMVVILGDYFDKLFKTNEEYVSLAINIMSYLVRACARENTKIRIVYGTESHEMNQYRLFNYHLTSSDIDMKIFDTATEEIIDGHHILYVPEEYIMDKRKHYAKFFNSSKHYDYIFGHGIIEDGMPGIVSVSHENNKNREKQVPRFKSGELSAVGDICVFGHYHVHTKVNGLVYYLGSLFRNSFGEEEPKYYGVIDDKDIRFIENTKAYVYRTYEFGPTSSIYNSADNIMNEISKIKEENKELFDGTHKGKIRLSFNTPENLDPTFRENLKNLVFNDPCIATLIKEPNSELIDEIKEDLEDEYDFIIDPSLGIIDKIYRYICMQYEVPPMTMEKLHGYIGKIIDGCNKTYIEPQDDTDNIVEQLGLTDTVHETVDKVMNEIAA